MSSKDRWEQTYSTRPSEKLGWYESHLQTSLKWIKKLDLPMDAPIIDVGGGASTLVDDLLNEGYRSITVLDLSKTALSLAQARLDKRAQTVTWLDGDIASIGLPIHGYELWHDRAAFHFLIAAERQRQYCDQLLKALRPGGHLIIATFAPEAPPECSGLPVQRYTSEELKNTLGQEFELRHDVKKMHFTPSGIKQMYLYCHFRRAASHCTN